MRRNKTINSMSRRTFVRSCVAGIAAAGVIASTASAVADKALSGPFIDIHTHIGRTWNQAKELTPKALLEWMDEQDITQAVVLPLVSPEAASFPLSTDFVLEQTKPHRERLIPFCCIDPRTSYAGGHHGLKYIIQSWAEQGAKGFGEHKPGLPVDDPRSQEIYGICGELKLPVLFHLDEQRNTDVPGLPGLEKMLKAFPQTIFIGHGPGWWASISGDVTAAQLGGYPTGKVAAGGAMDRLMEAYSNLYADLSAGSGAGALSRDLEFAKAFVTRRVDRLLFGTDYLSPGQKVSQFEVLAKLELPAEVQAKVFRDNARRMLALV
jgi:uncharacterized protein